jgi:hypothetical protein
MHVTRTTTRVHDWIQTGIHQERRHRREHEFSYTKAQMHCVCKQQRNNAMIQSHPDDLFYDYIWDTGTRDFDL